MADIKNFGIKGIAADVQMGKSGGRLKYDPVNGRFDLTQSDGSTLEDIRLGAVSAGTWTATAISTQYGGTGVDLSSSTGVVQVSGGVGSAGNISLTDANFIDTNSNLAIAQGGTGATNATDARTNLGLGTLAVQNDSAVGITGGTIDGVVIGGSSAGAITGTTVTATSGFVGDLTGTAANATVLETGRDIGLSGDASGNVTFDGSADVNLALTLATSGVTAGDYGSTTQIPTFTVDAKGRITAASNVAISTGFDISGDNGSNDTVSGGDTLTFTGTSGQVETTITDNQVEIGIVDGASIANLTVTGTFTSDDITSAAISIDGDATITGNLTVQGTQTTVNSTTVETADAIFRTNSNGAATDAGFEANTSGGVKQILYTTVGQEWDFGSENVNAATFTGDLTGDVTGQVSDVSNHSTADIAEDPSATVSSGTMYYTDARVETKIDSYVTGGVGVSVTSGTIDLDDTAVTAGNYGSTTQIPTFTVDAQGRLTAASNVSISTGFNIVGDDGTVDAFAGGDTLSILGGTNITTATSNDTITVELDADITLDSVSANNGFTGDLTGDVTGDISGATATMTGTVEGGSLTDGTATLSGGDLTGATSVTASGAVEGGSLTDGTATLSGGALSGATTGDFSGNVSADNFAATGAVEGASADFSGAVAFGSLTDGSISISSFLDDDTMATASDTTVPTSESVKAYVDSQLGETALTVAGNTGTAAIDLDSETLTISGGVGLSSEAYPLTNTVTFSLDNTAVSAGDYGSADSVATFTVDAQGRLTAAANASIAIAASQVTDFNAAISSYVTGSNGITESSGTISLDNTAVSAGDYGSATEIPTFTVDSTGRITAASNVAISTGFDIAGDNGSNDTVSGGETLSFVGASGQVETTITDNNVEIGIIDGASIANLTVTGTFTSDDITSSQISIAGDAVITGNLTVQGSQTIVDSTTVQTADAIFRTNSNGSNTDAGFEANTANGVKQILYTSVGGEWDFGSENVKASTFEGDLVGNASSATALETARDFSASGDASATAVSFDGTGNVDLALTLATVNSDVGTYGNATLIPSITVNAKGLVTGVTTNAVASDLSISGDSGTDSVSLLNDTLSFTGGDNITSTVTDNDVEFALDADITLTSVTATNVTASGNVQFAGLTDGTTTVTDIETAITDVDTAIPTSGAVIEYVTNNGGDGLILRSAVSADSANSTFDVGTVPNVSGRTYYASKVVIKVGTAFSGDSVNAIKITENGTSGSTLVAIDDADATTAGTYIVELDGETVLTKNAAITVSLVQADGTTPAVATAGAMTVSAHYNWVQ